MPEIVSVNLFSLLSGRGLISLAVSALAALLGAWNLQQTFSRVSHENTELNQQNQRILAQIDEMKARRVSLIKALDNNTREKNDLVKRSDGLRENLQKMLEGKMCVAEPVPADVIRLQREALATGEPTPPA